MSAVAALSEEQAGCIQSGDSYTSPFSQEKWAPNRRDGGA